MSLSLLTATSVATRSPRESIIDAPPRPSRPKPIAAIEEVFWPVLGNCSIVGGAGDSCGAGGSTSFGGLAFCVVGGAISTGGSTGFSVFGGSMEMKYLIMKNEESLIGLFQGMFENNIITFNPGWDQHAKNLESFDDIRMIQKDLKNEGISFMSEADESTQGPASFVIKDPDGNVILVDQHR